MKHTDFTSYRIAVLTEVGKREPRFVVKPALFDAIKSAYKAGKTAQEATEMVCRIITILKKGTH